MYALYICANHGFVATLSFFGIKFSVAVTMPCLWSG